MLLDRLPAGGGGGGTKGEMEGKGRVKGEGKADI